MSADIPPRCEYFGEYTGQCRKRAEYALGVSRSCGCGDLDGFLCAEHVHGPAPDRCFDCRAVGTITLTEPIRLRGAA